jgi:hypothetical protein
LKRGYPKILSVRKRRRENPVRIEHFPIETGLPTTGVDIMGCIFYEISK